MYPRHVPEAPEGVTVHVYDGYPGPYALDPLTELIFQRPFHVEVRFSRFEEVAQNLALRMR